MTAILPLVKIDPKDIPLSILILDEDEKITELSEGLIEKAPDVVAFESFSSQEALDEALANREIYGALVFPESFSEKLASLTTETPEKATIEIIVNEGANPTMAQLIETNLTNMVGIINTQMSTQILTMIGEKQEEMLAQFNPMLEAQAGPESPLAQLESMLSPIQPDKVLDLANPIEAEVIHAHASDNLGNAPIAYLTTAWFTSLIGAVILYLVGKHRPEATRQDQLKWQVIQTIMPFVYGIVGGYIATLYSTWLLGFEFEHFHRIAWYIAFCIVAFTFMILATVRWLRLPSIVIYIILMFFSMAAIQMAPEMMPSVYRDYIVSWLPLRIYADGLRDLLFYSQQIIDGYSMPLL